MGHDVGLLPGTLDLLILKAVSLGPLHGYGRAAAHRPDVRRGPGDRARCALPGLVPARGAKGLLRTRVGHLRTTTERRRTYQLTAAGRKAPPRRNGRMAAVDVRDGRSGSTAVMATALRARLEEISTCAPLDLSSWRFGNLVRPSRTEREMREELTFHIQSRAEDLVRKGLSASDADRQARLESRRNRALQGTVSRHQERPWCSRMPSAI